MDHPLYGHNYKIIERTTFDDSHQFYTFAIENWIRATENREFPPGDFYFEGDEEIRPLANMVRANSTKVGCSMAHCGNWTAVACFYDSPNVHGGDLVYRQGIGCNQQQEQCTTHANSSCDASANLCVLSNGETNEEELHRDQAKINEEIVGRDRVMIGDMPVGWNEMCPQNIQMTDELRQLALTLHNNLRSKLTTGDMVMYNGDYLPMASNMVKLRYNCALEQYAIQYAKRCLLDMSLASTPTIHQLHELATSRNAIRVTPHHADDHEQALRTAVKTWWKSVHTIDNDLLRENFWFRRNHWKESLHTFTQIAWANNHELGCAVVKCGINFNVVCQYAPGGNVMREPIYLFGEPCSDCLAGMSCESSTGLCIHKSAPSSLTLSLPVALLLAVIIPYFFQ
ncbi:hypothetical protein Q1695_006364 [Nippostrongylus brasiliensis]|nr:hypothetical protein Q1695_006364 [Nippostrongylus brasiliensis]